MRTSPAGLLFVVMLILSLIGVFKTNGDTAGGVRAITRAAIAPVARPLGESAQSVRGWFGSAHSPETAERRSDETLVAENRHLRAEVESLAGQLLALRRLNEERDLVGPLREFTTAVRVSGLAPSRNLLVLSGTAVTPGAAAIHASGMVGRVDASGRGVTLLTAPGFSVEASFVRWNRITGTREDLTVPGDVLVGSGDGKMIIRRYRLSQVGDNGLQPHDLAVLNDQEYPLALQGLRLARVTSIDPHESPGFVTITLEPTTDLTRLGEVMVMRE